MLILALPGSAYVYQGDELGLVQVTHLPDEVRQDPVRRRASVADPGRDGCRYGSPCPGTPRRTASARATPRGCPRHRTGAHRRSRRRTRTRLSTLNLYRAALRLRREVPGLRSDAMRWLESPHGTLVFRREPDMVCAVNLGDRAVRLDAAGTVRCASGPPTGSQRVGSYSRPTPPWYRRMVRADARSNSCRGPPRRAAPAG